MSYVMTIKALIVGARTLSHTLHTGPEASLALSRLLFNLDFKKISVAFDCWFDVVLPRAIYLVPVSLVRLLFDMATASFPSLVFRISQQALLSQSDLLGRRL